MKDNYTIILFKNKVRYKILKKYITFKKADKYYNDLLKKNQDVFFGVETECAKPVEFELALVEKHSKKIIPLFKTDPLGRNIPVKSDNDEFTIIKLESYKLPEKIFHIDSKTRMDCNDVVKKFIKGEGLKMISKLNNKVIIQDEDKFNLFSLKTDSDAIRFIDNLQNKLLSSGKNNCLFVKDTDMSQKKYLYEMLEDKGYNKKMLYRTTTTHLIGK
jgi:hypothetical protein